MTAWPSAPPTAADREAFAAATPRPFWLDRRPEVPDVPPLGGARRGRPLHRRRRLHRPLGGAAGEGARARAARRSCSRARRSAPAPAVATAASSPSSITHGHRQRPEPLPGRDRGRWSGSGSRTSTELREDLARHGIDCDYEDAGESRRGQPHQVEYLAEEAERLRAYGHDVELLDARGRAGRDRLADLPRRRLGQDGRGARRPGQARDGLAAPPPGSASRSASARRSRRSPTRAATVGRRDRRRLGPRAPGAAGDERVHAAAPIAAPLHRARLRLRARQRAAQPRAARRDRLALAPGRQRPRQPVPLLPADRRQPDPLGRLRGGLPLRRAGRASATTPTTRRSALLAQQLLRHLPAARGMRFSHHWGGAIDTCSRFSAFFDVSHGGKVGVRRRLHRPRRRQLAVRRRASRSTSLDGIETEATRARVRAARSPFPFPPEPLRWAVIQLTRERLAAADARAAGAGSGCGCSTGSGSASTAERIADRAPARRAGRVARCR